MRERKHFAALAHGVAQLLRLGERERHRLVANDVEAALQKFNRHRRVQKIRRDDGHEINPLIRRQRGFGLGHLGIAAIDAFGIQEQLLARRLRIFRIGRERARDEFDLTIKICSHAMHRADEGVLPAADHAVTKFAFHRIESIKLFSPQSHRDTECFLCGFVSLWLNYFFFEKAASNAAWFGAKSSLRTNAQLSVAPWMRSMRPSSHSTESGPR